MELIVAAVALAVVVVIRLHDRVRSRLSLERAFVGYFRGVRSDPWPVGVQEEDRDRPWGAAPARQDADDPVEVQTVPVQRVTAGRGR